MTIKAGAFCYMIQVNSDQTEGRGPMINLAAVADHNTARIVMLDDRFKRYNVQGIKSTAEDVRRHAKYFDIYQSPDDFWNNFGTNEVRKRAIAKLTMEEREVLGIRE